MPIAAVIAAAIAQAPAEPPKLMPYLASTNLLDADCLEPGGLIAQDPISDAAQGVKTALAGLGINYALWQAYAFVGVTGAQSGQRTAFNYYASEVYATWNAFSTAEMGGTAGWLTLGASAGTGLGFDGGAESPGTSIGSIGEPMGIENQQHVFVQQLAWQQSFLDGQLVVTAGLVNPDYYLDLNTYSNNPYNQLLNQEFWTTTLMPWSQQSMGVVVQWQPADWFYALWSSGANNTLPGQAPFSDLSSSDWTNTFEVGLVAEDLLGLGPGIYRAIPFVATVDGSTGAGLLVNLEQRLGRDGPLGAFVRAGFGNSNVTSLGGTEAIVSGGFVVEATSGSSFLREQRAFLALGAYWLDSALEGTPNGQEWGFEVTYVLPLTPTLTLQPDLQLILDPVSNAEHDASLALTLQLNMLW